MAEWKNPKLTVDAIVPTERGIVLVRRGRGPFAGKWALPGGFVEYGEDPERAVLREVEEETGLRGELLGLVGVYGAPGRDPRGHTVSVVYEVEAEGEPRGADDAAEAAPFLLGATPPLAFDHARILADWLRGQRTLGGQAIWYPDTPGLLDAHRDIIDRTGGAHGVLQRGVVEAAVERARWGPFVRADMAERAAFLLRGIALDHPFADGNKRTALGMADLFLLRNGADVEFAEEEAVQFILQVARGEHDVPGIAAWLRAHAHTPASIKRVAAYLPGMAADERPRDPAFEQALLSVLARRQRVFERLANL